MVKTSKRSKRERRERLSSSSSSSVPTFSGSGPELVSRKAQKHAFSGLGVRGSAGTGGGGNKLGQARRQRKELGFRDAWVSVQAMGATQLRGWRRRKWEADAFEALGGRGSKLGQEQKMPYKMRMGILKKRKQKLARAQAEELQSDVVTGHKYDASGGKRSKNRKRMMEAEVRDPMASRGMKFKSGVMFVQDVGGGGGKGGRGGRRS